jgi:pSer/pThr/pTyr-binding forkhead associated (FHA) protein
MIERAQWTVEIHVESGPHQGQRFLLSGPEIRLGRGAGNEVSLVNDHTVSERHARIYLDSGQWFAEDSGSRNGLFVQSHDQLSRISVPLPLQTETVLILGATRLRVRPSEVTPVTHTSPESHTACTVLHIAFSEGELRYRLSGSDPLSRQYAAAYPASLASRVGRDLARLAQRCNGGASDGMAELRELGSLLGSQIIPQRVREQLESLPSESLIISHDSELLDVPWELVPAGELLWCERFALGRQVVLGDLSQRTAVQRATGKQRMLIIADPRGDLPEARADAEALLWSLESRRSFLDVDFLAGGRATEVAVLRALESADLVYYIGHGTYDPERPEASGWQLSDGTLGPDRIRTLSRPPRFVFSNACNSAEETPQKKQQMGHAPNTGLASGLLLAGVGAVVGARWPIRAESSAALANVFFHRLLRGIPIGAALREARMVTRRARGDDDLSWAAFILYGNPVQRLAPIAPEAACK